MKKLILCLLALFMLTGCGAFSDENVLNTEGLNQRFGNVEDERFLFYDKKTKIIYYFTNGYAENAGCYSMPYYSSNGKLCRYIDEEIVEVDN